MSVANLTYSKPLKARFMKKGVREHICNRCMDNILFKIQESTFVIGAWTIYCLKFSIL